MAMEKITLSFEEKEELALVIQANLQEGISSPNVLVDQVMDDLNRIVKRRSDCPSEKGVRRQPHDSGDHPEGGVKVSCKAD